MEIISWFCSTISNLLSFNSTKVQILHIKNLANKIVFHRDTNPNSKDQLLNWKVTTPYVKNGVLFDGAGILKYSDNIECVIEISQQAGVFVIHLENEDIVWTCCSSKDKHHSPLVEHENIYSSLNA